MESELDKVLRLVALMLPQAQADALRLAVKAETDNFNAVLERTWASQRDLAAARDAAMAEVERLTRERDEARAAIDYAMSERAAVLARAEEAERERDAFASTYHAVNEVLLSGSTQRADPTAERVYSNLTRLMERADRAEKSERAASASLAAARDVLRQVEWSYRGIEDGSRPGECPICGRTRREGHDDACEVGRALGGDRG